MHEYLRRILLAQANGIFIEPGYSNLTICHDNNCSIHKGQDCDCDPWLIVEAEKEVFCIGKNGEKTLHPSKGFTLKKTTIQ